MGYFTVVVSTKIRCAQVLLSRIGVKQANTEHRCGFCRSHTMGGVFNHYTGRGRDPQALSGHEKNSGVGLAMFDIIATNNLSKENV